MPLLQAPTGVAWTWSSAQGLTWHKPRVTPDILLLCRGVNDGLDYNQVQELIDDLNIGRNRGVSEPRLQQAFNDADADHDGCAPGRVHSPLKFHAASHDSAGRTRLPCCCRHLKCTHGVVICCAVCRVIDLGQFVDIYQHVY